MNKNRRPERITREQPVGAGRKQSGTGSCGGKRPRSYRPAWAPRSGGTAVPVRDKGRRLSEAPHDLLLRAAREKHPWIRRFVDEGCPRGKLLPYARRYAEAQGLPPEAVPPYTTLNTWVHRYLENGMLGLIDSPNGLAGRSKTITDRVAREFEVGATLGMGTTRILNYLAKALPPDVPLPSRSAVARELRRFEQREPMLVAWARKGPAWFRDNAEVALSHGVFPGGMRISIDSTVADLWVRIPDAAQPTGYRALRPVLTIVEDVGSRLLITFNLSLMAIDSGICLAVLGRALNQEQNYPGLLSIGAPHEITMDKGAEHQGAFRERLGMLGIEVVPRMDNDPRGGAHVERLIGTITTEVFANEIGYSKTERLYDPYAPADRDTKRSLTQLKYEPYKLEIPVKALLPLSALEARLLAWATVYNERPHPGLRLDTAEMQRVLQGLHRVVDRPHPFDDVVAGSPNTEDVA